MVDTDDTRRTTNDGRRTTPRVWHKLPTGELKINLYLAFFFWMCTQFACRTKIYQFDMACPIYQYIFRLNISEVVNYTNIKDMKEFFIINYQLILIILIHHK